MGTKLKTTADAVQYLRDQAWLAVESRKGNRAERLHFCADLLAKMAQEPVDAGDRTEVVIRFDILQTPHRKMSDQLGRYKTIETRRAFEAVEEMLGEAEADLLSDEEAYREWCGCDQCQMMTASAPQEAIQGPSLGAELPTQPVGEDGAVAASGEHLADFMLAMQDVVDAYAEHLSSVEIVGAMELVKDETLEVTRLGNAEAYLGRF